MRASACLLLTLIVLPAGAPVVAAAPEPSPYALFAAQEARIAAIGYRLTTANAGWCAAIQPQFGWLLGDPRLYDAKHRADALAAYGAGDADTPYVAAVAPGSPAATAGVRPGTPIAAVNGAPVPAADNSEPFSRIAAIEALLGALPPASSVRIDGGSAAAIEVAPAPGCVTDFRLEPSARVGAFASGRVIRVNTGLVEFAGDDAELAAAIAHELAHNILRHPARLSEAGVDRGLAKQFGRNARLFRQTEVEADRLSVWLLAGAGYDPHAAERFWTRFGKQKGSPLIQPGTHPRWRARVAALAAESAAIDAARSAGRPLEPPLVAAPPPLE